MYYGQIFILLILRGIFKLAFNKQSWCSQKKAKVSFVRFVASKNWIKKMVCESNQFSLRNLYIDSSVLVLFRYALLEHLNFIFSAVLFVFGGNEFLDAKTLRNLLKNLYFNLSYFTHYFFIENCAPLKLVIFFWMDLLGKFLKDFYYWDTFCMLGYQWKRSQLSPCL